MPCSSTLQEPPCQSQSISTPTGCCADGRQCDEVCIAIVAAEECKQAGRACADALSNLDDCCGDEKVLSSKQPGSIHHQQSIDKQDSCCKDHDDNCTKKGAANCCEDDCKDGQCGSLTEVARDGCWGFEKQLEENDDKCSGFQGPEHCADGTSGADEHIAKNPGKMDSCCDSKDTLSICSTAPLADVSVIADFQEACSSHLAEAMKKYKAYLEGGICVCRNALRQVNICCDKNRRAAFSNKRKILPNTTKSCTADKNATVKCCKSEGARESKDKNCSSKNTQAKNSAEIQRSCEKSCCSARNHKNKNCCSKNTQAKNSAEIQRSCEKSCCSAEKDNIVSAISTDVSCEPVVHKLADSIKSPNISKFADDVQDPENGAAREHLTFNITGMTCTGCVKKVMGVLANVPGVDNPKVNFVAAIGDVDIDMAKTAATQVLHRLEKETGFKCSRIVSDYQTLDLDMVSSLARAFTAKPPKGVVSIDKVGKHTYRVSYDPLLIGARAVLAGSDGQVAPPKNNEAVSESRRRLMLMLWSFLVATLFTVPVCVLAFSDAAVAVLTKHIVELVLATVVQLIAVPHFYIPALKALIFSKTIEMDMLVVISITAAYFYSVVAFSLQVSGIHLEQGPLFETSTLLITLVLLGRLVATYAKVRAVQAVSLKSLQPETAFLENALSEVIEIDARLLEFNDVIRIPAYSKIVSDGQVISGESAVDESMLTGESLPVHKIASDTVTAGTLNGPGLLRIRLTRLPGNNSITDIADLVQNALNSKPRIQDLADIVAGYFVPVVVSISVVVFAIWIAIALRVRNENGGGAVGTAITYTIAVLAISCPCALGLAVPLVLVISGGVAARNGVIIKQADATEKGFRVTDIVFDKTGTLTTGQLEVMQQIVHASSLKSHQAFDVAYSLVKDDLHPVAQAVAAKLKSQDVSAEAVEAIRSVPACGIEAIWQGQKVKVGNPYWLGVDTFPPIAALQAKGYTLLCLMISGQLVASFALMATIRPEAHSVIGALHGRGLTCHIVSGDQPTTVVNVATSLGIQLDNIAYRQSPANKQKYIQNLKTVGKITLFIGDGTNDAVAIAAANVGVQIGSASDVTRATADVVLLGGLEGILTLLEVSKQSFRRIMFNFVWSGVYNMFAILLASGAFVKVRIAPTYAGLGEIVSVLPVVLAALTMLKVKVVMS